MPPSRHLPPPLHSPAPLRPLDVIAMVTAYAARTEGAECGAGTRGAFLHAPPLWAGRGEGTSPDLFRLSLVFLQLLSTACLGSRAVVISKYWSSNNPHKTLLFAENCANIFPILILILHKTLKDESALIQIKTVKSQMYLKELYLHALGAQ